MRDGKVQPDRRAAQHFHAPLFTVDEAITQLGRERVLEVLASGQPFARCATLARNDDRFGDHAAYQVLAASPVGTVRWACLTESELHEAFLEGSAHAVGELRRRGLVVSVNLADHPAWL